MRINKRIIIEYELAQVADADLRVPRGTYTRIAREHDCTHQYVAVTAMRLGYSTSIEPSSIAEEIRQRLREEPLQEGEAIHGWAKRHGYSPGTAAYAKETM